eukprot:457867-Heterocapsa_arctica.AAC.1
MCRGARPGPRTRSCSLATILRPKWPLPWLLSGFLLKPGMGPADQLPAPNFPHALRLGGSLVAL